MTIVAAIGAAAGVGLAAVIWRDSRRVERLVRERPGLGGPRSLEDRLVGEVLLPFARPRGVDNVLPIGVSLARGSSRPGLQVGRRPAVDTVSRAPGDHGFGADEDEVSTGPWVDRA